MIYACSVVSAVVATAALAATPAAHAVAPSTTRVVNANGEQLNARADFPAISRDGRWLAFATTATNAVADVPGRISQTYLADRATGELRLLSRAADGRQGNG